MLLELHEDQVPELDEALIAAVGRSAVGPELGSLVPEDLRTGTAGPGVGHTPVVVLVEPLDALGGHADLVAPDGLGLVVADVHGDPDALGVEAQARGDEVPGEGAGVRLEVVAEAEVAHHLEEGEVAAGAPHLVEVVVLAACTDALLDGDGPVPGRPLLADEVGLEGHHPRHGEEQRRVVRDQAGRGLVMVPVAGEEVNERLTDAACGCRLLWHGRASLPVGPSGLGSGIGPAPTEPCEEASHAEERRRGESGGGLDGGADPARRLAKVVGGVEQVLNPVQVAGGPLDHPVHVGDQRDRLPVQGIDRCVQVPEHATHPDGGHRQESEARHGHDQGDPGDAHGDSSGSESSAMRRATSASNPCGDGS